MADASNNSISDAPGDVTRLLAAAAAGDHAAPEQLLPLVYGELIRIARSRMTGERAGHTLQPTALVHEAYLRIVGVDNTLIDWRNRAHFYHVAAEAMRRILVDHARRRLRVKRGGGRQPAALDTLDVPADAESDDILALDEAICRLEERDPRAAQVVRLRYYAGLSVEDTAAALDLSPRTVKREWSFARAWLFDELRKT
ncbi:MAG: sigma-70 family RNA polymerase sigma factor [Phycisphaerales bacterium]|nr:sigma-70 family RNA polymerase sigma factor [Phycisphaerales bacterium]